MKKRYTEEQIIGFLREADAGLPIKELCRKHGFSEASYYGWKLKRLLANSMLEVDALREVLKGK
jgi:putative transposase